MVIGTGCGIPAIMACRTIRNERERRTSAMLATIATPFEYLLVPVVGIAAWQLAAAAIVLGQTLVNSANI